MTTTPAETTAPLEKDEATRSRQDELLPAAVTVVSPKLAVQWGGIPAPSPSDWIGLHHVGAPDSAFVTYSYTTGGSSGSVAFLPPKKIVPGRYEMRLFSNDGLTRLAGGAPIHAYGAAQLSSTGPTAPGESAKVWWDSIPTPSGSDWIGFYPAGELDDTKYRAYFYVAGHASGMTTFAVPADTPPGSYELRLFANDGYTRLATTGFRVSSVASLSTAVNAPATPGGSLKVFWKDVQWASTADWIGLFAVGAADYTYVTWSHTNGANAGSLYLNIPADTPPGQYELRMFSNDSTARLAVNTLLVKASTKLTTLDHHTCPPDQVTVIWYYIPAPTNADWAGLFPPGAPDTGYVSWRYTNGQRNGSLALPVPAGTAPGVYQVRLFAADGFGLLGAADVEL